MNGNFWQDKRVIVTGGAGFLGSYVIPKLKERGATDIFIPRIEDYDLTNHDSIKRLFSGQISHVRCGKIVVDIAPLTDTGYFLQLVDNVFIGLGYFGSTGVIELIFKKVPVRHFYGRNVAAGSDDD